MMRAVLLTLLLGLVLCVGCSEGPGGFCVKDSDCEPPLRCTGRGGQRGVCTYPFDQGVAVDQRPPSDRGGDLPREARIPDRAPEAGRPDAAIDVPPDQRILDHAPSDTRREPMMPAQ